MREPHNYWLPSLLLFALTPLRIILNSLPELARASIALDKIDTLGPISHDDYYFSCADHIIKLDYCQVEYIKKIKD